MPPVLAAYLTVAVLVAVAGPALGRRVFLVAGVAPLTALVWAASQTTAVLDGERPSAALAWVPALGLDLDLRLTPMGLLMTWLIAGIGVLVMAYATAYFEDRPGLGRFAATLTLFGGAMCGLVWSDSLLGLFVFWELTSICSYLLIGFDDRSETARNSALQALLITGGGGLALLGGLVLLATEADTWSLSGLVAARPTGTAVTVGVVLVLLGAFTKSAQVPFHGWLPGAMAAPTPVSAYLHSATMVKAGVYLVAVLAPGLAHVGVWRPLTVGVGVATMVWGAYQSLRREDLKLILAYGTIGALGLLIALFGVASPKATFAAVGVLLAHAIYKASLFMVVGIVDHAAHSRDIHRLRGLRSVMPATAAVAALAGASMAALPATFGFVTKEAALEGLLKAHLTAATVLLVGLVVFSAITAAAVWRFWQGAFTDGPAPPDGADEHAPIDPATVHAPTAAFVAPAAVLAILGVVLGIVPGLVDPLVESTAASLDPAAGAYELHAFAGFNAAFGLSALALAAAGLLIWAQRPVTRLQATLSAGPTAGQAFRAAVAGLLRGANLVAGAVQHGSLPIYLATILLTVVVVPGVALIGLVGLPEGWVWADSPLQALGALAVVVVAVGVTRARRRFAATLLLGSVGYVVATLFIAYDAPDLALTQFLVETVAVVAFVLVLRQLPESFDAVPWLGRQALRIVVSVLVGLLVFGFLLATGGDGPPPPTDELMAEAAPEGGGTNVVNVILTDIRGLDTLGEGTVVAIAALGVLALTALLQGRRHSAPSLADQQRLPTHGGVERSPVLDTAVQAMLPLVFALSLFLLMAGHNAPGGGFIGGLVAAAGLVLRTVARPDVAPYRWERFEWLIGVGMLLTAGMAMSGWIGGDQVLDLHPFAVEVPVLGKVKATGALPFDIGVYLIVVGLMVAILHGLSRGQLPGPLDGGPDGGDPTTPDEHRATEPATTAPTPAGATTTPPTEHPTDLPLTTGTGARP